MHAGYARSNHLDCSLAIYVFRAEQLSSPSALIYLLLWQSGSGKTTLSDSGMLLPDTLYDADVANGVLGVSRTRDFGLVLTVASVVEPFLSPQHREGNSQGLPELIPGAQIDVMLEGKLWSEKEVDGGNEEAPFWLTAQLIRLVDVPVSSIALQSILEASSSSMDHSWEVGWSLSTHDNGSQPSKDVLKIQREHDNRSLMEGHKHLEMGVTNNPSFIGKSTIRIAILGVCSHLKDLPAVSISFSIARGSSLLVVASPFGILSPVHFFNSMSAGSITNCHPAGTSNMSLLMADIRCLPGTEGGPVFGERGHFIGILIRPLRQKTSGAEIQLVIPWEAIASACSDLLLKVPQKAETGIHVNKENLDAVGNAGCHGLDGPSSYMYQRLNSYCPPLLPVEKAATSICLVTIDEGVWASGVLLNYQGLILTNAHLLEPWRFGKTTVSGGRHEMESEFDFFESEKSAVPTGGDVNGWQKGQTLVPNSRKVVDSSLAGESKEYKFSFSYQGRRHIRVRLDHANSWTWYDAKVVYVCKGPLDVALLQIVHDAGRLCPINVDFACPPLGSRVYVIGHGLFGPRCGLFPSVCSGVVTKIVNTKASPYHQSIEGGDIHVPAMLETTAAVYAGSSGGAVINSEGLMIGLVTSNARHGGGTVIPYLNFSIPSAVLVPIFAFARDMQDTSPLQDLDQPNAQLSSVWALMPPLSPNPNPPSLNLPESMLEDNKKQGKGLKFAKFIAENSKVMTTSTRFGKAESFLNRTFPSKL